MGCSGPEAGKVSPDVIKYNKFSALPCQMTRTTERMFNPHFKLLLASISKVNKLGAARAYSKADAEPRTEGQSLRNRAQAPQLLPSSVSLAVCLNCSVRTVCKHAYRNAPFRSLDGGCNV